MTDVFDEFDIPKNRFLTSYQISRCLGTAISTVNYWIDQGRLKGFRTPGGHRRVRRKDLLEFLQKYHYVPGGKKERTILVVDDDASLRRALGRLIKSQKIPAKICYAEDGFSAGIQLLSEEPSVVVLDIHLPGIDGFKIMNQIRRLKDPPAVIAISGESNAALRRKVLENGAAEFFPKPFDKKAFIETIKRLLD